MSTVLFVVTAARTWALTDGTAHPTGFWAEELLAPYRLLTDAGHDIAFATPGGVPPVVDVSSLADGDVAAIAAIPALSTPLVLGDVDPAAYDAVYYPGGHGPMQDLAEDAASAALITATLAAGRPLAAVCHGLAALPRMIALSKADLVPPEDVEAALVNWRERTGLPVLATSAATGASPPDGAVP